MLETNSSSTTSSCDNGGVHYPQQPQHYYHNNNDEEEEQQEQQQHELHDVRRSSRRLQHRYSIVAISVLLLLLATSSQSNILAQQAAVHPHRLGPQKHHSQDHSPSQHFIGPLLIPIKVNVGGEWTSSLGKKIQLEDLFHLTGGSVVASTNHAHARAGASLAKTKLHPLVHVGNITTSKDEEEHNYDNVSFHVDAITTTTTPTPSSSSSTIQGDDLESESNDDGVVSLHVEHQALLYDYSSHNNVTTTTTTTDSASTSQNHRPLKILFLSSDTGGGHRASAESLAKVFVEELGGSDNVTYELLDVWKEEGVWPYNTLVESYQRLSHRPQKWRFMYHWSNLRPIGAMYNLHAYISCIKRIQRRLSQINPDVVISVHPGMNFVPVRAIRRINLQKRRKKAQKQQQPQLRSPSLSSDESKASLLSSSSTALMSSIDLESESDFSLPAAVSVTDHNQDDFVGDIPFFTVVTDYGGAHNQWFDRLANHIYIASKPLERIAINRRHVSPSNLSLIGLPIRQSFTQQAEKLDDRTTEEGKRYQQYVRQSLGLMDEDGIDNHYSHKIILVMGGGEGVGSLEAIVNELSLRFSLSEQNNVTIVVVCGRNERLREKLNSREQQQQDNKSTVNVIGLGFVSNIDEYMVASDVLITKAGPGTIAEATALGLPLILTSYIPGQEYGNIDLVVRQQFGVYETNPRQVANIAHEWLSSDNTEYYNQLSRNSLKQGRPNAARDIVQDILKRI